MSRWWIPHYFPTEIVGGIRQFRARYHDSNRGRGCLNWDIFSLPNRTRPPFVPCPVKLVAGVVLYIILYRI